jgi:hypothetical protein
VGGACSVSRHRCRLAVRASLIHRLSRRTLPLPGTARPRTIGFATPEDAGRVSTADHGAGDTSPPPSLPADRAAHVAAPVGHRVDQPFLAQHRDPLSFATLFCPGCLPWRRRNHPGEDEVHRLPTCSAAVMERSYSGWPQANRSKSIRTGPVTVIIRFSTCASPCTGPSGRAPLLHPARRCCTPPPWPSGRCQNQRVQGQPGKP